MTDSTVTNHDLSDSAGPGAGEPGTAAPEGAAPGSGAQGFAAQATVGDRTAGDQRRGDQDPGDQDPGDQDPGDQDPGDAAEADRADGAPGRRTSGGAGENGSGSPATPASPGPRQRRGARPSASAGLVKVTDAVLTAVMVKPGDQVVDLGCRAGRLSLALAQAGASVLAVDPSPAALRRLKERAQARSVTGIETRAVQLDKLTLPARSVDLIVTSYSMHRLQDDQKEQLVKLAYQALRPGGTLVIADMMFGRGGSSRDRAIIKSKLRSLSRKGPGGWWRIAKNSVRYLLRTSDYPVPITVWTAMLTRCGFTNLTAKSIVNEAGLVTGHRPAA